MQRVGWAAYGASGGEVMATVFALFLLPLLWPMSPLKDLGGLGFKSWPWWQALVSCLEGPGSGWTSSPGSVSHGLLLLGSLL